MTRGVYVFVELLFLSYWFERLISSCQSKIAANSKTGNFARYVDVLSATIWRRREFLNIVSAIVPMARLRLAELLVTMRSVEFLRQMTWIDPGNGERLHLDNFIQIERSI